MSGEVYRYTSHGLVCIWKSSALVIPILCILNNTCLMKMESVIVRNGAEILTQSPHSPYSSQSVHEMPVYICAPIGDAVSIVNLHGSGFHFRNEDEFHIREQEYGRGSR
jgi:hypothetical protein